MKVFIEIPNNHKNQILSDNLYNDAKTSCLTLVHKLSLSTTRDSFFLSLADTQDLGDPVFNLPAFLGHHYKLYLQSPPTFVLTTLFLGHPLVHHN